MCPVVDIVATVSARKEEVCASKENNLLGGEIAATAAKHHTEIMGKGERNRSLPNERVPTESAMTSDTYEVTSGGDEWCKG